jgi:hypothetical protein
VKAVACFIILVGAAASVVWAAEPSSAPVQGTSGALQISSAPVAITLAPPRAAPTASEGDAAATQNVVPGVAPEDHGKLRGYTRVVDNGHERYCRNDVGTGSHLARNLTCLTYKQLQIEQARAQEFLETVQRQSALGNVPTNMSGMASGNNPGMGH